MVLEPGDVVECPGNVFMVLTLVGVEQLTGLLVVQPNCIGEWGMETISISYTNISGGEEMCGICTPAQITILRHSIRSIVGHIGIYEMFAIMDWVTSLKLFKEEEKKYHAYMCNSHNGSLTNEWASVSREYLINTGKSKNNYLWLASKIELANQITKDDQITS